MISPNELDQIEHKAPKMEPYWLRAAVVRLVAEVRQMRAVAELADQINARKAGSDKEGIRASQELAFEAGRLSAVLQYGYVPDEVTEAEMRAAQEGK